MVVSFHVSAEIKPRTPGGAASALSLLAIYPDPDFPFRESISQKQRKLTSMIPDQIAASYFPAGSSPGAGLPSQRQWLHVSSGLPPASLVLGVGSKLSLLLHLTISFAHPISILKETLWFVTPPPQKLYHFKRLKLKMNTTIIRAVPVPMALVILRACCCVVLQGVIVYGPTVAHSSYFCLTKASRFSSRLLRSLPQRPGSHWQLLSQPAPPPQLLDGLQGRSGQLPMASSLCCLAC